jgi:sulfite reductase (ferredoxin)
VEEINMETVYQLPPNSREDVDQFRREVERLSTGTSTAAEFRAFRVPRGVYEQREADTYMLRVRLPAGLLFPDQMRMLADVARRYGTAVLHVTSRQDIQVHRVLPQDIHPALVQLHEAGLSTKGGGGNTVRNITGCCDAGVCAREVFDPTPQVLALTEFLLRDPLSYQLPRKYKIAFSACPQDCAGATINDLGFIARRKGDQHGFAVYVAGGMGASSRVGDLLEEFIPVEDIHRVAEAVKRVFDQHGNRRNRHKARLRFLVEQIGLSRFRQLYQEQLTNLHLDDLPPRAAREAVRSGSPVSPAPQDPVAGFEKWLQRYAEKQRQEDYFLVHIPLLLGDIAAETLQRLAGIVARYGEGALRTTQRQNLVLRWVGRDELPAVHAELQTLGLAGGEAPILANLVACTGAATCRLGICLSRGLARAIRSALAASGLDLDRLGDLAIHVSGCPNACGRHPVADIGLFGAARRVEGRLVPHYVLQLGGSVVENKTRLAVGEDSLPARNVPALVVDLLDRFRGSVEWPDFSRFAQFARDGLLPELIAKHSALPDLGTHKEYCTDWEAKELFSLAGRGPGECGAGVFDLIEVDLQSARDALRQDRRLEATVLAARSLLVTRGEQAENEYRVLELFSKHFLDEHLVAESYRALIERAGHALAPGKSQGPFAEAAAVSKFVAAVEALYRNMDDSLRFKANPEPGAGAQSQQKLVVDRRADFRGVVCPLNFVKTKIALATMVSGNVLSVLLDEAGARNVPGSVAQEGHEVLSVEQEQDHWRILVRKA